MEEGPPVTARDNETLEKELRELRRQLEERTAALSQANLELTQEIAARRRAEAAERAQREFFQVTLASIGDAVMVTDARGVVTFINPVAQALTGWARDEAVGRPLPEVFDIVNEETRSPVENPVSKVLREGGVAGLANHTLLRTKSGAAIPIDDSAAPIRDAHGQLQGVVLVFRDISERRQAEQALRRSEARYRTVSDLVADYAYAVRVDPGGRNVLEWVTDAFSRITGFTVQDLEAGNGLEGLIHPEDMPRVRQRLRVLFAGQPGSSEHRIVTKGGEVRWLRDYSAPERDPVRGRIVRIIGAGQDITERKQAEAALAQRTAELERSNEALQQFAYIVSHDLQEPLRTMTGFVQLLAQRYQGRLDPEADEFLRYVSEGVTRMQALIRDLLTYVRTGSRGLRRAPTDCQALWQQVLLDLRAAVEEHGAAVTCDPLPTVSADE
jgi:PAS domain S-box-containing protein